MAAGHVTTSYAQRSAQLKENRLHEPFKHTNATPVMILNCWTPSSSTAIWTIGPLGQDFAQQWIVFVFINVMNTNVPRSSQLLFEVA